MAPDCLTVLVLGEPVATIVYQVRPSPALGIITGDALIGLAAVRCAARAQFDLPWTLTEGFMFVVYRGVRTVFLEAPRVVLVDFVSSLPIPSIGRASGDVPDIS